MDTTDTKLTNFLNKKNGSATANPDAEVKAPARGPNGEIIVSQRDGLFERREIINPKHVTSDGRQLLREDLYRA